ncbi:hypothetical protein GS506_16480 [Rhodococcus hoagii]|nr:hypothetical protein [Prescottella equi]
MQGRCARPWLRSTSQPRQLSGEPRVGAASSRIMEATGADLATMQRMSHGTMNVPNPGWTRT